MVCHFGQPRNIFLYRTGLVVVCQSGQPRNIFLYRTGLVVVCQFGQPRSILLCQTGRSNDLLVWFKEKEHVVRQAGLMIC